MAATNKRGVFSLETVLERQGDNHWSKIPEVFRYVNAIITSAPAFGYLAGGKSSSGDRSSVDRIDYGNDTATAAPKGTLVSNSDGGNIAGTGNQSFGYTCGTSITNVNRIDYGNDTATAVRKGTLSSARAYISAVGNRNFGYWCGGNLSRSSFIDRLDYSNDTAASTPKGPLSRSILASAATGNSDFGYVGGLYPGMSLTERIDYSNDTAGTLDKGALIASGYMVAAAGNSDFGYWNGGSHGSRVGRLDYANDSVNAVFRGNTAFTGVKRAGTGSGSFGYFTGGDPSPQTTIIDRVDYSNDTSISTKGNLSLGKYYHAGVSAQENGLAANPIPATRTETGYAPAGTDFGYWAGGQNPYVSSIIQRLDFSNDTGTMSGRTNLSHPKFTAAGSVSSTSFGYFVGGYGPAYQSGIDRLDYSNDTATATPTGTITNPTQSQGSAGTNSYGYIAGGIKSPGYSYLSSVERLDYSSDSSTTSKGPLNVPKLGLAGMGNSSYGWFAGGVTPGSPNYVISKTDRVDYSNDTATSSPKGDLSRNVGNVPAAAGNSDYGWISGGRQISGFVKFSTVDRIDYSNDTATATPKGPLPATRYKNTATGNTSYGWHGAGKDPSGKSNVYRIDYSNDTASASTRGPLAANTYGIGATSSRENALPTIGPKTVDKGSDGYTTTSLGPAYGYWSGGIGPSNLSSVDRIDYASDATNMVTKGPLTEVGYYFVGISSPAYGYTCGNLTPGYKSYVQRADYANDTATAVVKGPLTRSDGSGAGLNSRSYGYVAGGQNPSNNSYVDRIDFSNDSATALSKGNLDTGRGKCAGTSNQNYGWATGGIEPGTTKVSRIDFSNDTATSSPKGDMVTDRMGHSGSGNADYGYLAAGRNNYKSSVDRIDYSNDTATAVEKGPLSIGRRYVDGVSSPSYGWHAGGETPTKISTCDRIDYSNDTATAAVKGPLTTTRAWFMGNHSSQSNDGGTSSFIPRIRWVDSATETPAVTAAPGHAYFGGGGPSPSGKTIVDRLDFSNDSAAMAPKGSLSQSRKQLTAVGSPSYAYMMGGYDANASPGYELSYIDRIDYASDTSTATPKGLLAEGTYYAGATGTASYGYNGGGRASSGVISCTVQRIDYSNDTATASPKGYLTIRRRNFAGCVGNTSYGYWSGGENNASTFISTTERVDFSNDTAAAVVKGPVDGPVRGASDGTGNANYGYYAGGYYPDSPAPAHRYSIVSRIDYSSDTGTIPTKAALSNSLSATGAAGNASYGYWGAGADPSGLKTSVDRIDFSNDTSTPTVVTAYLSNARAQAGAASGLMYGLPQTASAAVAAPVQPPFPLPTPLPVPPPPAPVPYAFDHESATSIAGTIGSQSRTGTYCDPETDLATGITYGSQDSTPFNTSTDRNSEIIRCYSFTNYSGRTFAAAICALCEKPPQGGTWPISNSWESAWWLQSGNDDSDILIVVFDSVKTFSGVEISSPSSQYNSSNDHVYAVRLSGSASSFTTDAIGDVAYNGSTTATISASFSAQAIAIYRNGATGWARIGNIRFLK